MKRAQTLRQRSPISWGKSILCSETQPPQYSYWRYNSLSWLAYPPAASAPAPPTFAGTDFVHVGYTAPSWISSSVKHTTTNQICKPMTSQRAKSWRSTYLKGNDSKTIPKNLVVEKSARLHILWFKDVMNLWWVFKWKFQPIVKITYFSFCLWC